MHHLHGFSIPLDLHNGSGGSREAPPARDPQQDPIYKISSGLTLECSRYLSRDKYLSCDKCSHHSE